VGPLSHGCGSVTGYALLLALFLLLVVRKVSPEPYVYDEADYIYAASLGFSANWTDSPSIPVSAFVRAGLHREGRQTLSERIRAGNDVLFYRHFHGPLLEYLLIPVSRIGLDERTVRTLMLAIPAASIGVIYFGCLWLLPLNIGRPGALLAAMLFLSSYSVVWSTELAPHQLFALCSLACLILLLKAVAGGQRGYWYGAVATAGLALCTLEVAVGLIPTLAICAISERTRWRADWQFAGRSIATLLGTMLVVWPASILRLSLPKSCAVMGYLALQRQAPWGNAGFLETWRMRLLSSPLEWAIIGASLFLLTRKPRLYPLAVFAALMLAATLRVVTGTPRYSLAFLPELDLFAGLALIPSFGRLRRPASGAVVALAVAGLYGSAWYQVARSPGNPNPRSAAVLSYIHQNTLENKALLVPQTDLPTLHYYFPGMRLRGYFGRTPTASDRSGFHPDAVLYTGDTVHAAWNR
jgi:Dolichyl-phosphate-mannose-protein mannosyltransferase